MTRIISPITHDAHAPADHPSLSPQNNYCIQPSDSPLRGSAREGLRHHAGTASPAEVTGIVETAPYLVLSAGWAVLLRVWEGRGMTWLRPREQERLNAETVGV